jgi:hypothetical protein
MTQSLNFEDYSATLAVRFPGVPALNVEDHMATLYLIPHAQFHLFAESPRGAGGEEEIVRKWRNGNEIMASHGGGVRVSRRGPERPRTDLSFEADHHHRAGVAGGRDRYARAHPGAAL